MQLLYVTVLVLAAAAFASAEDEKENPMMAMITTCAKELDISDETLKSMKEGEESTKGDANEICACMMGKMGATKEGDKWNMNNMIENMPGDVQAPIKDCVDKAESCVEQMKCLEPKQ